LRVRDKAPLFVINTAITHILCSYDDYDDEGAVSKKKLRVIKPLYLVRVPKMRG
jgi:hypothetical protein